jgi:hypothetical protein
LQNKYNAFINPQDLKKITELDVNEFEQEILFHKDNIDKNVSDGYQMLFWKILPYKVPIALQSAIALPKDFEGNEINDIFDMSENVRMQYMHLAVFPLQTESVVLAFYHKRDKLYRKLRHTMNSSSEKQILQFLNYLIFAYTENYFISKNIKETIEIDEKLSLLSQENNGNPRLGFLSSDNYFGMDYQPVSMDEIPDFLSEEWAVT